MGLFGWTKEPMPTAQQDNQQQAIDQTQLATTVATAVATALQPLFAQRSFAAPAQEPQTQPEPEQDDDPELTAKVAKVAQSIFASGAQPIMETLGVAVPDLVRTNVVNSLTEGEKIVYARHKQEVDNAIATAARNNPRAALDPEYHRRAIQMVLGANTREIEAAIMERLQVQDLPLHLQPPSASSGNGQPAQEPLTAIELNQVEYFNYSSPSGKKQSWDADSLRYWKNMKPGYMHEMVAEHKAKQDALKQVQTEQK